MAKSVRPTKFPDPPMAQFLSGSTAMAWVWLAVRVWLGIQWIEAALHKVGDPAWIQTGTALKLLWEDGIRHGRARVATGPATILRKGYAMMSARLASKLIVTVALTLLVLSFGWTAGAAKAQKITITLQEYSFTPTRVTLQAGVPVEIKLVNKGKLSHEFTVYTTPRGKVSDWDEYAMTNTYFRDMGEVQTEFDGIGAAAGTRVFEVQVQPDKEAAVKFTPTRKGTFEIGCHVQGHYEAGMKGVWTVK